MHAHSFRTSLFREFDAQGNMSTISNLLAMVMDHMLHERDNTMGLDKAIESIVVALGHFDGRKIFRYVVSYKLEMYLRDVLEAKELTRFKGMCGLPKCLVPKHSVFCWKSIHLKKGKH